MAEKERSPDNEALYLAGGIALMIFGAGLVLSSPTLRQFLIGQMAGRLGESEKALQGLAGVLPDLERYLRIRAM